MSALYTYHTCSYGVIGTILAGSMYIADSEEVRRSNITSYVYGLEACKTCNYMCVRLYWNSCHSWSQRSSHAWRRWIRKYSVDDENINLSEFIRLNWDVQVQLWRLIPKAPNLAFYEGDGWGWLCDHFLPFDWRYTQSTVASFLHVSLYLFSMGGAILKITITWRSHDIFHPPLLLTVITCI